MLPKPRHAKLFSPFQKKHSSIPNVSSSHIPTHDSENICLDPTSMPPSKQALAFLLESCSAQPKLLKQIHSVILTTGLSVKNSLITQLLISFTVLGHMSYARNLLDELHKPRAFLWNTVIRGYVKHELPSEAASVYRKMRDVGVRPDEFTFPYLIKACALGEFGAGLAVHGHLSKLGLERRRVLATELVMMYVKNGDLGYADHLFESMEDRDLVAWNAFIAVCAQHGHAVKTVGLFNKMSRKGIEPDSVTVVSTISACGQLGCLETGEKIYWFARRKGIDCNIMVDNARLDMFAKCGSIGMAEELFNAMPDRNIVSWSTMICGYAINGESEKALALFSRMEFDKRVKPNYVTYLGVLSACRHAGLVDEGWRQFNYISRSSDKNLQPRKEHYACMVDLLGRSGYIEDAYKFIIRMPIEPDAAVWGALLGACVIHRNIEIGQRVAHILFALAPDIASYHVLLANMFAAAGEWGSVKKVRQKMRRNSVNKVGAYSSTEINGEIHILYGGDRSHPLCSHIYKNLNDLVEKMKSIGYTPKTDFVFHDVELEEKEVALKTHSEKLAIALGLMISRRPEVPIRVTKNLRTCNDCHTFTKLVSKFTRREIIVRDINRFHHFRDGVCSCKDFW